MSATARGTVGADSVVGDWIALAWEPVPGATLCPMFAETPPMAPVPFDRLVDASGGTFVAEPGLEASSPFGWVRVPRGVFHVELDAWCRPDPVDVPADDRQSGGAEWVVGVMIAWFRRESLGGDANELRRWDEPDEVTVRYLSVPPCLPVPPAVGLPVHFSAVVRAPTAGHLALLLGSNRVVRARGGDRINAVVVRAG